MAWVDLKISKGNLEKSFASLPSFTSESLLCLLLHWEVPSLPKPGGVTFQKISKNCSWVATHRQCL